MKEDQLVRLALSAVKTQYGYLINIPVENGTSGSIYFESIDDVYNFYLKEI